jgi:hypothetical protein
MSERIDISGDLAGGLAPVLLEILTLRQLVEIASAPAVAYRPNPPPGLQNGSARHE